jgi:hypothetical protein
VGTIAFQSTSDVHTLGNYIGGNQRFADRLDEMRVYAEALSASEIAELAGQISLVGHWKFDETSGTTAVDSAEGNNNGTLQGGAAFVADSTRNQVLQMSDPGDFVAVSPVVDLGSSWTITSWFKGLTNTGTWRTLTRGQGGDHQIIVAANGLLGSYDNVGGTGFQSSGFNMNGLSGGWHHVAAVSGSSTVFYIDGVQVGTIAFQSTSDVHTLGNYIGGNQRFADRLDEMRVYAEALSAAEIAELAGQSSPIEAMASTVTRGRTTAVLATTPFVELAWNGVGYPERVWASKTRTTDDAVRSTEGHNDAPPPVASRGVACRQSRLRVWDENLRHFVENVSSPAGDLESVLDDLTIKSI